MKCFCHLNGLAVKDATARKEIEEVKQAFSEVTTLVESFNVRLPIVEAQIENLNNDLSTTNGSIVALSNSINYMNTIINGLATDLSNLATRVTALENAGGDSGSGDNGDSGSGDNGDSGSGDNGDSGSGDDNGNDPVEIKLAAPTITLTGDLLQIADNSGGNVVAYYVYVDGEQKAIVEYLESHLYLTTLNLAYGSHTIKVKATGYEGYTDSNFSNSVVYTVNKPQLVAPSISVTGNYLYLIDNNGGKATAFEIYKDGILLTTIASTTCYLPTYIRTDGTYTMTAKAKADGYATSPSSIGVTYTKTTVDTRPTLSGKWLVNATPSIGDVFEDGLSERFSPSVTVGGVSEINAINIYAGENSIYYEESASGSDELVYDVTKEKWSCMGPTEVEVGNYPELMRQLDFGTGVKVSDAFYNWFTANAEQVNEFPEVEEEESEYTPTTYAFKDLMVENEEYTEAGNWVSNNLGNHYGKFKIVGDDTVYTIIDFHNDSDEADSVYAWTDGHVPGTWDEDPGWVGDWMGGTMNNIIVLEEPTGTFAEMLENCCTKVS